MKKVALSLVVVVFALLVSCSKTQAEQPKNIAENTAKKQTILFFMNPHGRPCQIQDSIILSMDDEIIKSASVRYVKTTERAVAMPLFQKHGVRALPTLIVLDEHGNEKKRFSPGIQGAEQITKALQ